MAVPSLSFSSGSSGLLKANHSAAGGVVTVLLGFWEVRFSGGTRLIIP